MMKAAVFKKPYVIETVCKQIPHVSGENQVLVKVKYSGLCGSDLHYYRGNIPLVIGQTMGHEFVGTVAEKTSDIPDSVLAMGDDVISTFTIQCGKCWYCKHGYSGTCLNTNTFGKAGLEGAQAEYVLVPYATSTLVKKPRNDGKVDDSIYTLLADIFVTGYFGVKKVVDHYQNVLPVEEISVLQMGAGPVGLCAVRILRELGFKKIVVVDSNQARLDFAAKLGATETANFQSEPDKLQTLITTLTEERGFDAVLEMVGANSAMKTAFDSVRKGGFISSVGMGHDSLPFTALECYVKGLSISFGRCNTWSLFNEALAVFEKVKGDLGDLIEAKPSIEEAAEYYKKFEKGEIKKVVFKF